MNSLQKKIAKALGLDSLSEVERNEMMIRVGAVIYQSILMRVVEILTEEEQDEFEKLLDGKATGPEDVFVFLKSKIENIETIIDEEAIKFKTRSNNIMDQIG